MRSSVTDSVPVFQGFGEVFQIIKTALQDIWDDIWAVLVINLIWTFCVLTIIPGPPATLALFRYANRLVHGEIVEVKDFTSELKRCWGAGWRWGLINLPVCAVLIGDIFLSNQNNMSSTVFPYVQSFYIALLVIWLLLQTWVLSFMVEQEQPQVKTAFRNSFLMLRSNFSFSIAYAFELILMILFGAVLFMSIFAVGGVLLADVGNRAVLLVLAKQKAKDEGNKVCITE